jgi:membrane protease YdiL (CAAX protease family)
MIIYRWPVFLVADHEAAILVVASCSPAIAAIVTRLGFQRTLRGMGWNGARIKYYAVAFALPIVYLSAVYVPLWAIGYGTLHPDAFDWVTGTLPVSGGHHRFGNVSAVVGAATTLIQLAGLALGEELGWRGFLVPELAKITSFTKLALITGIVWAVWHFPALIHVDCCGVGLGYYLPVFTVSIVGESFMYAWFRLKSDSVWVPTILHASYNLWIGMFASVTRHVNGSEVVVHGFGRWDYLQAVMLAGLALAGTVLGFIFWDKRRELPNGFGPTHINPLVD